MNFIGVAAVVLSVVAFAVTYTQLRPRLISTRILYLCRLALLAVPSVWFAVAYLRILRAHCSFYALRSWPGCGFLVVFLGCAAGAAAALLARLLVGLPLFAVLALGVVPYIRPV